MLHGAIAPVSLLCVVEKEREGGREGDKERERAITKKQKIMKQKIMREDKARQIRHTHKTNTRLVQDKRQTQDKIK